ncbi:sigma-54 dependent transcriptional regulator [Candidatus Kapabacteria bacterium]|nr:sigma-54 dependent transcriptional regulator [Candidatus Kapabacteria bacterium]
MAKKNYTIVVIEDDPLVNETVNEIMSTKYSRVYKYEDAQKALDEMHLISPDLVLLDIFLGHHNGLDILENLRKQGYNMPVIMMTAFSDIKMAVRAMKLGAEDFIVKPLDLEQLEISTEKALENYDLRRQVDILSEQLKEEKSSEIIGNSEGVRKALEMAQIVSKADTTILVYGESGTGKELLARYVHDNSPRAKGPFIAINCGAIPKDLAENELFGYERGAFTGATEKFRPGKFEQANHGTILLDEIGELSLDIQVRLLRVLQERKFYRLGGQKEISVDVRVVAATNKNLEELVETGEFREDLFYRLNVAQVHLPALRDRGDDIMIIATSFVDKYNKTFRKKITGFTPEAADIMKRYSWRGNIRELQNVIERVVLLENDNIITKSSLSFLKMDKKAPESNLVKQATSEEVELAEGQHLLKISSSGVSLGNIIKDLIVQTLKITNGNQIQAAKLLGISRAKLRYRIEQQGININNKTITN